MTKQHRNLVTHIHELQHEFNSEVYSMSKHERTAAIVSFIIIILTIIYLNAS